MPASPFRDELASAHEKIQQLEMLNEALRARLQRGPIHAPPRASFLVPLTAAWAILMTATVVRISGREMSAPVTAAPVMRVPPQPQARAYCPEPPRSTGVFKPQQLGI
jgi:hypothetical protein